MGNPISKNVEFGTLGELLVQLRLLEYEVQAAPPIKDSGNDLIAIKEKIVKFVQVKTRKGNKFNLSNLPKIYDVVVLVQLSCLDHPICLDNAKMYIMKKNEITKLSYKISELEDYKMSSDSIAKVWGE